MELRDQLQKALGDNYTLERELGGGGMARVFVAHERTLGRRVVVKTLGADFAASVSTERFRREIRLAASLQQANIVPVHAAGEVDGLPYYTMPFVEGESLRTHLTKHGRLPVREAVSILRDVARALSFAHQRGVVHRDIKPENVLLSGSTAVVTDFGIAKAIEAAQTSLDATMLTHIGAALGTPAYISPEQAAGDPHVDHRADIYALGVVAYELLTGAPPFSGRTAAALMAAHINERPIGIGERCRDAPHSLAMLVMRCLEKDPARRPQSANEVLDALDTATTPPPVVAAATSGAKPSIAVLPFANLSPDPADEYFADGLTDEIITDLSAIPALRVIARAAMMRFKGNDRDPGVVARELGVGYALDGSVRRAGVSLRLTARLVEAESGATMWSDKLGGAVEDVFQMQEQVSRRIVEALRVTLTPHEERRLAERPISDVRAYEYYLQARQATWLFTVPSLERATQLLEHALSIVGDDNALLLGGLGHVHIMFLETGEGDHARHLEEAERCARRIEQIAPDGFERHWLQALLHYRRGEMREAMESLARARALRPNSADVACMQCYVYILSGQDDRARQAADDAIALDPLTPLLQTMPGVCAWVLGRFEDALPHYRAYLQADPLNPSAHLFLVIVLAHCGRTAEAIEVARNLADRFPETSYGQLGRALGYALDGKAHESREALTAQLRAAPAHSEMFGRFLAELHALNGDADASIDALEDAVRLGLAHYPYLATHSRLLEPVRAHPRFRQLLDVVRARWERGGTSADDHAHTKAG